MKKLIVTEESLEKAMRCLSEPVDMHANQTWQVLRMVRQVFDALFVEEDEVRQKPKPQFGPGTRLRAKNGDELLIVKYFTDWGIVNLSKNTFGDADIAEGWWSPVMLERQLIRAGAEVIEEDEK